MEIKWLNQFISYFLFKEIKGFSVKKKGEFEQFIKEQGKNIYSFLFLTILVSKYLTRKQKNFFLG